MPEFPSIPLVQAQASVDADFCRFRTVQDWLDFFVENIVGDGSSITTQVRLSFSPSEPTGDDFGDLWVKETGGGSANPRGVGLLIDGEYVIIPIPEDAAAPVNQIPTGAIMFYPTGTVPEGWSGISDSGLPSLPGSSPFQYIRKN